MAHKHLIFLMMLILLPTISATQSLGTFQQNSNVYLQQGCDDSTYANITKIIYPNSTYALNTETAMNKNGFTYDYLFVNTEAIGDYIVYGHCDEGGTDTVWVYDFGVTTTGSKVSLSNSVVVIVFLLMGGIFLAIGVSFSKEHWIIKSFFNFFAVGMGILALNSAKIIASESTNLGTMGTVGLTMGVVVFSFFFLYMFVFYFIETIKSLREKKGVRWEYD